MKLVLQIALGIILAGVMIWTGSILMARAAIEAAVETAERATEQAKKQQFERRVQREMLEIERAERNRDHQQRQKDLMVARAKAEADKESAWLTFYKKSAACENPPTWDEQVECGNQHIRAKRKFEKNWAERSYITAETTPNNAK